MYICSLLKITFEADNRLKSCQSLLCKRIMPVLLKSMTNVNSNCRALIHQLLYIHICRAWFAVIPSSYIQRTLNYIYMGRGEHT